MGYAKVLIPWLVSGGLSGEFLKRFVMTVRDYCDLLGWSAQDLVVESRLSRETVDKLFRGEKVRRASAVKAVAAINLALRKRGYKEVRLDDIEGLVYV
jgi:hypothetical protein